MQFKDALCSSDTIDAVINKGVCGTFVDIEIQCSGNEECVLLTKEDAAAFGRLLIELSEQI